MLGLRFCTRAFSSCSKRVPLTIAASLAVEHRLQTRRFSSVAHGPRCSAARGILPDQGSNPSPLHRQADSQPLRHQGSPMQLSFMAKGTLMLKGRQAEIRNLEKSWLESLWEQVILGKLSQFSGLSSLRSSESFSSWGVGMLPTAAAQGYNDLSYLEPDKMWSQRKKQRLLEHQCNL